MALFPDNVNSSSKQVGKGRVREWVLISLSHELESLENNMYNFIIYLVIIISKICRRRKNFRYGRKRQCKETEIKSYIKNSQNKCLRHFYSIFGIELMDLAIFFKSTFHTQSLRVIRNAVLFVRDLFGAVGRIIGRSHAIQAV